MQARVEGYAAEKRRGYSVYYPDLNVAEVRRERPSRHLIRFAAATTTSATATYTAVPEPSRTLPLPATHNAAAVTIVAAPPLDALQARLLPSERFRSDSLRQRDERRPYVRPHKSHKEGWTLPRRSKSPLEASQRPASAYL